MISEEKMVTSGCLVVEKKTSLRLAEKELTG